MEKKKRKIIASGFLALLSIILVVIFWRDNVLLAGLLFAIGIVTLFIWKEKKNIYLYVIAGLLGAIAEAFAISFGVWNYSNPTFFNIPLWLPFLWGEAALFISTLILELREIKK